jgi:transcription elongation factor GreA
MDQQVAQVGSRVRIRDEDGEAVIELAAELADPFEGRLSVDSPLGRALLGHCAGERVRFRAPGGVMAVTVLSVG